MFLCRYVGKLNLPDLDTIVIYIAETTDGPVPPDPSGAAGTGARMPATSDGSTNTVPRQNRSFEARLSSREVGQPMA
jgi:hypothetical protein